MASPFRVFRKNVKPLLVVFGCLLVLAWVGGSSLSTLMQNRQATVGENSRRIPGATAVSWEGGSLTNQDLDQLVVRRQIANDFQKQVYMSGQQSAYEAGIEPSDLRVQPLIGAETHEQGVESSVVRTKLFADAAREAGMKVTDQAVNQYLQELGRGRVTTDDMRTILQRTKARGVTVEYIFEALRDEMLAQNYFKSNLYASRTITPQQKWQDWLSANDHVVVEAAAIPVEQFMIDVKDPTDPELTAYFDKYKEDEPGPDIAVMRSYNVELPRATPGFHVPRKIDAQYIQANYNDLVTKAEGEVTEEEIAKFYNDNKDLFVKADTALMDDPGAAPATPNKDESPATDATKPAEGGEAKPPAPGAEGAKSDATAPPAGTEDAKESGAAPNETPATSPSTTPPATEPPQGEAPPAAGTQPPAETPQPEKKDQSSLNNGRGRGAFRQVAFLQDTKSDDAAANAGATESSPATPPAQPAASAPATPAAGEPASGATTSTDASVPATGDAATKPAETTPPPPANTQPAGAPPAAGAPAATKPASDTAPGAAAPATEKPKQYQPLDEVRDEIRLDLAKQKVNDKLTKQINELLGELQGEFTSYFTKVLDAQSKKEQAPVPQPALADLKPLADKYGFAAGKTGSIPYLEFRSTPVGKTGNADTGEPLTATLFSKNDLELYSPLMTVDIDGNRFVSMKTSDTPARTPKLEDVKGDVVRAWKMGEAAKRAEKDAQSQAEKAKAAGKPLTEYFAGQPNVKVVRTDPFAQITRGDVPDQNGQQRYHLSQPDGLVAAGPEFMQKVFSLKDGDVAAVLNHDHSIAYVVRLAEHANTQDQLRAAYLGEASTWEGLPAMIGDHMATAQKSLVADLTGGNGVEWKRDPDSTAKDEGAEAPAEE